MLNNLKDLRDGLTDLVVKISNLLLAGSREEEGFHLLLQCIILKKETDKVKKHVKFT